LKKLFLFVLSMRQTLRERQSSALLSEPATTQDLIETLRERDYKVIGCDRIESCLEGKWIARIVHQSRPDQILENENIWLHGFEVSFITGDDEAQFLPKSTPSIQEDEPALDQWSDASSRRESSHISWCLPNEEEDQQPTTQPVTGIEIANVANFWDIQPELVGNPSLNVKESSEDEPAEGDERDSSVSSQEHDLETQNHELREEVARLREQVMKLGVMARTRYKTKDAFIAAAKDLHFKERNKTLEEQNEQLRAESSSLREVNQQLQEKNNVVSMENERLKEENSKLREEMCCKDNI